MVLAISFDPLSWLGAMMAQAALWGFQSLFVIIDKTSVFVEPDVTQGWFIAQYKIMGHIMIFALVPMVLVATISALFKGGLREILHTYLIKVPMAILGAAAAIVVVVVLQKIAQNFTDAITANARENFQAFFNNLSFLNKVQASSVEALLLILIAPFAILGVLVLWIELILREILVYLSLVFIPFTLAMFMWRPLRTWFTAVFEVLIAAIFTKFIVVASLSLSLAAVVSFINPTTTSTFGQLGLLIFGIVGLFFSLFAAPALVALVLAPSHQQVRRTDVTKNSPINSDRRNARNAVTGPVSKQLKSLNPLGRSK